MNTSQIQAYVQEFMHTNDTATIAQVPNFVALAASRIAAVLKGAVLELSTTYPQAGPFPVPADFISARLVKVGDTVAPWVSPDELAVRDSALPSAFTVIAGNLSFSPSPANDVSMAYFGLNQASPDSISVQLPSLLVQGAVAEGLKYEGDIDGANDALADFERQLRAADGWEIHGTITLGGVR